MKSIFNFDWSSIAFEPCVGVISDMRGKLSGEEIRLCADCWFQCAVVKPVSGVMLSVLFSHSILDFSHLKCKLIQCSKQRQVS